MNLLSGYLKCLLAVSLVFCGVPTVHAKEKRNPEAEFAAGFAAAAQKQTTLRDLITAFLPSFSKTDQAHILKRAHEDGLINPPTFSANKNTIVMKYKGETSELELLNYKTGKFALNGYEFKAKKFDTAAEALSYYEKIANESEKKSAWMSLITPEAHAEFIILGVAIGLLIVASLYVRSILASGTTAAFDTLKEEITKHSIIGMKLVCADVSVSAIHTQTLVGTPSATGEGCQIVERVAAIQPDTEIRITGRPCYGFTTAGTEYADVATRGTSGRRTILSGETMHDYFSLYEAACLCCRVNECREKVEEEDELKLKESASSLTCPAAGTGVSTPSERRRSR